MPRSFLRPTPGERTFTLFNYIFLALLGALTLLPFWYTLVMALNRGTDFARGGVYLWPRVWSWENFSAVFANSIVLKYFGISIARVLILTPAHLLVTGMAAWAISRRKLPARKFFAMFFVITMFVNPGLIPTYLTLVQYKLINKLMVYVLPWLFSGWEMMIMVVAMRQIPEGVIESAYIDGASDLRVFFKIVIPLSTAALATIGLFNAVWTWGDWFTGSFFINTHEKWTIATYLRMVLQQGASLQARNAADAAALANSNAHVTTLTEASLRAATLVVTILPIVCVYPFLQKYFIHGVMLGSLKE